MKKPLFMLTLFALATLWSCQQSNLENARKQLLRFAQGQKTNASFHFKTLESDSGLTTVLLNKAVGRQVAFGKGDTSLLIGIYGFQAKGTGVPTITKSQLVKRDTVITLEIVDAAGKVIDKIISRIPEDGTPDPPPTPPTPPTYGSFDECLDDYFNGPEYAALQKKANETCKTQWGFAFCCLKDGTCAYFDFIQIRPTRFKCTFRIEMADVPAVMTL